MKRIALLMFSILLVGCDTQQALYHEDYATAKLKCVGNGDVELVQVSYAYINVHCTNGAQFIGIKKNR